MLIDRGGASMRDDDEFDADWFKPSGTARSTVTFSVTETHDGQACDCIDQTMTLTIGQEIELTHVCHDGRVDKVVAKICAITGAGPEHGKAQSR